jgi:hypothetical protein
LGRGFGPASPYPGRRSLVTIDEKMVERITKVLPRIPSNSEDVRVLTYIRTQLTPEGLDNRTGDFGGDPGVTHLHDVANRRLLPYETEAPMPVGDEDYA